MSRRSRASWTETASECETGIAAGPVVSGARHTHDQRFGVRTVPGNPTPIARRPFDRRPFEERDRQSGQLSTVDLEPEAPMKPVSEVQVLIERAVNFEFRGGSE